uniref:uncharacterized protein LOC120341214 n=1 Tax=Styela clava TaxID=7725 RepID=UPI001939C8D0|nr:uncharacterized protein LOC120341214 [Styela clava]
MSYFDPKLCTEIIVDASPDGLGCVLVQKESDIDNEYVRVIAYASRLLNDVESRYSQIEREALAVVIAKPSARIERWCLRLQQYTFNIVHRPGKTNPADYMSRHPIEMQNVHSDKVTEEYVNYVCENTCPKAIKLCEIKSASENDSVIQNVIKSLQNNLWYKYEDCGEMSIFAKIASELCVTEQGILLRGKRIVIPVCLRRKIVGIAHEGHMGMSKTKSLLREKIWFPGMDAVVENVVKSCAACASVVKDERMLPLSMSSMITAQSPNIGSKTRNASLFKKVNDCTFRKRFTNITGADVLHDNDISDDTANLNADNETADPIAESTSPSVPPVPSVRDRPRRCPKVPSRFKDFHMGRITLLTA